MFFIRWRVAAYLLLVLALTSCGFHLRGPVPLAPPLQNLYLQTADPYSQLSRMLEHSLELSGVHLAENSAVASTVLVILKEETNQQLLSVGGTQQTRQYNLILSVTFQITTPQGVILVPTQTMTEMVTITIQADQVLAGSNEAANIYQQMRRTLVNNLMNRLASKRTTDSVTSLEALASKSKGI